MCTRMYGRFLLAAAGLALLPALSLAQPGPGATNYAPEQPQVPLPLYSERPESGGFYTAFEFVFMHQTRAIGDQIVAFRGFQDSTGRLTGTPGRYVGSGAVALETSDLGRTTWEPGFNIALGYRLQNGWSFDVEYTHLFSAKYSGGASGVPPGFAGPSDLSDTFLVAPVFNFPSLWAGPNVKSVFDLALNPSPTATPGNQPIAEGGASAMYGIWNGATQMDQRFTQRFDKVDLNLRIPIAQNDYQRYYAITGFRFAWFWDNYWWRTVSESLAFNLINQILVPGQGRDIIRIIPGVPPILQVANGQEQQAITLAGQVPAGSSPEDVATYSNVVSNRMYGPLAGCGYDWYLLNNFAFSSEFTGAALLDIVKERAKYVRGDGATEDKRARSEYQVVPNLNVVANLWWYPIEGIQVRVGYQAMGFFNTISMEDPVAFNFGALDPPYRHQAFRLVHGINVGIGFIF